MLTTLFSSSHPNFRDILHRPDLSLYLIILLQTLQASSVSVVFKFRLRGQIHQIALSLFNYNLSGKLRQIKATGFGLLFLDFPWP